MLKDLRKHWHTKEWVLLAAAMFFSMALMTILNPDFLKAGFLPDAWDDKINNVDELVRPPNGTGEYMLKNLITHNVIPLFKYIFVAVSILYFTLSVFLMVTAGSDEERVSKYRTSMLWGLMGFAMISLSSEIATALDPAQNGGVDATAAGAKTVMQKVISYLQLAMGIIAIAFTFYSGAQVISAGDDEEASGKAKKHFMWGLTGLAIAILANPLVNKVFYPSDQTVGAEEVQSFGFEMVGVLKFLLSFLAVIAFIGLVVAGVLYITSMGEEDKQNQAKHIITASVIGIVLIASSYALLAVFIPSS